MECGGRATARAVRGTVAYPVLLVRTGGCGETMGVHRGCSGDGGAMRVSWRRQWRRRRATLLLWVHAKVKEEAESEMKAVGGSG